MRLPHETSSVRVTCVLRYLIQTWLVPRRKDLNLFIRLNKFDRLFFLICNLTRISPWFNQTRSIFHTTDHLNILSQIAIPQHDVPLIIEIREYIIISTWHVHLKTRAALILYSDLRALRFAFRARFRFLEHLARLRHFRFCFLCYATTYVCCVSFIYVIKTTHNFVWGIQITVGFVLCLLIFPNVAIE